MCRGMPASNPDLIEPCVAIPVEDLNISEPVEGYPSNYYKKRFAANPVPGGPGLPAQAAQMNSDGEMYFPTPFDHPLDLDFELAQNGTTQNYKSVHLQRLADPMFPWNPPPYLVRRHERSTRGISRICPSIPT